MSEAAVARTRSLPAVEVAVTLACMAAWIVAGHTPLPYLDREVLEKAASLHARSISVGAVGLRSFITAFVIVELVALLPNLRHLRQDGRRKLWRAAILLGVALCALQSFGVVRYLSSTRLPTEQGISFALPVFFSLWAGACLAAALASIIDARGFGRGWSALLAAEALEEILAAASRFDEQPPSAIYVLLLVGGGTLLVFTHRRSALRLPSSGLQPVAQGLWILGMLPWFGLPEKLMANRAPADWDFSSVRTAATLAVPVALCIAYSYLFHFRAPAAQREGLPAATAKSALLISGLVVAQRYATVDLVSLAMLIAVALDWGAELRLRLAEGALVSVATLQRAEDADALVASLAGKGVPAAAVGGYHRTTLQFFGPMIPVDVLVPAERAGEVMEVSPK